MHNLFMRDQHTRMNRPHILLKGFVGLCDPTSYVVGGNSHGKVSQGKLALGEKPEKVRFRKTL